MWRRADVETSRCGDNTKAASRLDAVRGRIPNLVHGYIATTTVTQDDLVTLHFLLPSAYVAKHVLRDGLCRYGRGRLCRLWSLVELPCLLVREDAGGDRILILAVRLEMPVLRTWQPQAEVTTRRGERVPMLTISSSCSHSLSPSSYKIRKKPSGLIFFTVPANHFLLSAHHRLMRRPTSCFVALGRGGC